MSLAKQNNVRYSDGSISYFTNTAFQNVNKAFVVNFTSSLIFINYKYAFLSPFKVDKKVVKKRMKS